MPDLRFHALDVVVGVSLLLVTIYSVYRAWTTLVDILRLLVVSFFKISHTLVGELSYLLTRVIGLIVAIVFGVLLLIWIARNTSALNEEDLQRCESFLGESLTFSAANRLIANVQGLSFNLYSFISPSFLFSSITSYFKPT